MMLDSELKIIQQQKRFSQEQIKSLEAIFQSESKLQPRKKLQIAKDLGLQPRQVAIWFQNKRARWKSKQLQTDYNILRLSYDSLSSRFDILQTQNQSLTLQLKKLQQEMEKKATSSSNKSMGIVVSDADSIKPPVEQSSMIHGHRDKWDDLDMSNQWWESWC
ncbi:homeobox-leucine zipper protein ATHB-12-like [Cynara cardunculus var. scolymus]|uniref:homeobox-leucine zipper protein ATHB-12-like n=1 Tax=Cynara cardunculus var. scolymus TaxID=59895 RepID=UPI000D627A64|nr:homeobox-leucine zipper protein ATHB-12-like [Cynara cardunculus var. scolymus]